MPEKAATSVLVHGDEAYTTWQVMMVSGIAGLPQNFVQRV